MIKTKSIERILQQYQAKGLTSQQVRSTRNSNNAITSPQMQQYCLNQNTQRKNNRDSSASHLTRSTSKLDQKIKKYAKGVLHEGDINPQRKISVPKNGSHKRNNTGLGILGTLKNKNNLETINHNPYQNLNPILTTQTPKTSSKAINKYHTSRPSYDKEKENSTKKQRVFSTSQKITPLRKKSKKSQSRQIQNVQMIQPERPNRNSSPFDLIQYQSKREQSMKKLVMQLEQIKKNQARNVDLQMMGISIVTPKSNHQPLQNKTVIFSSKPFNPSPKEELSQCTYQKDKDSNDIYLQICGIQSNTNKCNDSKVDVKNEQDQLQNNFLIQGFKVFYEKRIPKEDLSTNKEEETKDFKIIATEVKVEPEESPISFKIIKDDYSALGEQYQFSYHEDQSSNMNSFPELMNSSREEIRQHLQIIDIKNRQSNQNMLSHREGTKAPKEQIAHLKSCYSVESITAKNDFQVQFLQESIDQKCMIVKENSMKNTPIKFINRDPSTQVLQMTAKKSVTPKIEQSVAKEIQQVSTIQSENVRPQMIKNTRIRTKNPVKQRITTQVLQEQSSNINKSKVSKTSEVVKPIVKKVKKSMNQTTSTNVQLKNKNIEEERYQTQILTQCKPYSFLLRHRQSSVIGLLN